jgi:WD40 repeat protein
VGADGAEVAHEALFSRWPRLNQWLADDAAGRRLRKRLTPAAFDWLDSGRPESDLLRGARLAEAQEWVQRHPGDLIAVEQQYVEVSAAAADHEHEQALRRARQQTRSARRLRAALAATAALTAVTLVAGALALGSDRRAQSARDAADAARVGAQALLEPRTDLSLQLAVQGVALVSNAQTRSDLLAALLRTPQLLRVTDLGHRLEGLAVAPDGRTVAVSDNQGAIRLLDAGSLRLVRTLSGPTGLPVTGLTFSADGARLISADQLPEGAALTIRDVVTGRVETRVAVPDLYSTAISPQATTITAGVATGGYLWMRSGDGWNRRWFAGAPATGTTSDGLEFATVGATGAAIRRASTGAVVRSLPAVVGDGGVQALSPDGRTLATSTGNGTVLLWDTTTGRQTADLSAHVAGLESLQFSQDGALLIDADDDGTAAVWDVATGSRVEQLRAAQAPITAAAFASDARTAWTVSQDGTVAAWDLTGQRGFGTTTRVPENVTTASVAPGGHAIVVGTSTGEVDELDTSTLRPVARWRTADAVTAVAISPSGEQALVGTRRAGAMLLALSAGSAVRPIGTPGDVGGLAWSPDGLTGAVTYQGVNRAAIVDLRTGRVVRAWPLTGPPGTAAWSPDGGLVAVGVTGSSVHVMDARTGRTTSVLHVSTDPVAPAVVFVGDRSLVVGGRDGSVRSWDAEGGRPTSDPIPTTGGIVTWLAATGTPGMVLVTGYDGSVVLVDMLAGQRIGTALPGPGDQTVVGLADLVSDQVIAIYSGGVAVRWPLRVTDWVHHACALTADRITPAQWRATLGHRPYAPSC